MLSMRWRCQIGAASVGKWTTEVWTSDEEEDAAQTSATDPRWPHQLQHMADMQEMRDLVEKHEVG